MTTAETPKLIQPSDHVYVRQEIDNIGWIDTGTHVIAVDALEKPDAEEDVFNLLSETVGDKPVKYLLNTHIHYDHIALNQAFENRCGTTIINRKTADIPATGRWFDGDQCRVLMLPIPNLHTAEDCVIWVEPDRVLFTGDLFGWGLIPLCRALTGETTQQLHDAYQRMIGFGAKHVVPGHGPVCTTAELQRWLDYFDWLISIATAGYNKGEDEERIRAKMDAPADMRDWWRFEQWKHEDSVKKVLHAARRQRFS